MKGLKIFLIVLFVVGILFILSITLGSAHADDNNAQTPGWLSGFGARFVGPQPLKLTDLHPTPASCLQQGNLVTPAGGTCTFAIQQSTFTQRQIMAQLVQGSGVTLILTQEQTLPVQESLTGTGATTNTDLKVYPGKTHAVLTIQCQASKEASACLLALK